MITVTSSVELFPGITYDLESKKLRLSDTEFEYYDTSKSVLLKIIDRVDDVLRFHDDSSCGMHRLGMLQTGAEITLCYCDTPMLSVSIVNVKQTTGWEHQIKVALLPKHADSSPTDEQWDVGWALCGLMREADQQYQALRDSGAVVGIGGPSILYDLAELCPKIPAFGGCIHA